MEWKEELITKLNSEIKPKLDIDRHSGGYDCCGCSTLSQMYDDIIKLIEEK